MVARLLARLLLAAGLGLLLAPGVHAQAADNKPWTCTKDRDGLPVLRFGGPIDPGEAGRFRAAWQGCFPGGYGGMRTLSLESDGGVVDEALEIAGFLVAQFLGKPPLLVTRVEPGARCISACTYLFVAGQRRIVDSGGSLEPHGFSRYLGTRADRALGAIARTAEASNARVCAVARARGDFAWLSRSRAIGEGLALVLADRRLAWIQPFVDGAPAGCEAIERRVRAFQALSPERAELLGWLDSVMAVTLPEVERAAALRAFRTQFAIQAGQASSDGVPLLDRPDRQLRWALDASLAGINAYLERTGQGPRLQDIDLAAEDLRAVHQRVISDASDAATGKLGSYLARRRNDVDVPAFVKLMFSTSILYTRPVSREELCDHNLVNVGCE